MRPTCRELISQRLLRKNSGALAIDIHKEYFGVLQHEKGKIHKHFLHYESSDTFKDCSKTLSEKERMTLKL